MLVAVEGPSAVGKTTLLREMPPEQVVGEEPLRTPDGMSREETSSHAAALNARRWNRLLEVEERHGCAYADGDPLKLYYDFARVSIGELDRETYEAGWHLMERAMVDERIGFSDCVIFLSAPLEELARRRVGDTTRRRRKFALHARLIPAMRAYYETLERIRPGTVRWLNAEGYLPEAIPPALLEQTFHRRNRYTVSDLESLKHELDLMLPKDR